MRGTVCKKLKKITQKAENKENPLLSNYSLLKQMYGQLGWKDKVAFMKEFS